MNRKGFAVTAVIYGLSILGVLIISILMGTLSSSRNNVKEEAKQVERELIAFNKTSVIYSSGENTFTVPEGESGWYRVEAFGRRFNSYQGAYTTGIIYLKEKQRLFIAIGTNEEQDTIVKAATNNGPIIMKAAAAYGTHPGGTLQSYSSEPVGGEIDPNTSRLKGTNNDLIGARNITFDPNGPAKSEIAGYPGSTEAKEYNGEKYYFVDGLMLAATNQDVGKVIITRLARQDDETPTIPRANEKFNNVNYIKIHNQSGVNITGVYVNCDGKQVGYAGSSVAPDFNVDLKENGRSISCDIDDVSILFDTNGKKYIKDVSVQFIKGTGENVTVYRGFGDTKGFTSTPTGIKLSAYQLDYMREVPYYGNFYIIPATVPNKVVSAQRNSESEENEIGVEYLTGAPRQKWSISRITSLNVLDDPEHDVEYYITEQARYKAIAISLDDNVARNRINATMTFNTLSRNKPQIWKIISLNDGTFAIKTVVKSYNESHRSGFITVDTSRKVCVEPCVGNPTEFFGYLMLGYAQNDTASSDSVLEPTATERFYLYNLDFGYLYK